MADVEPEFDVEKDFPELLSSVLDRTEECIRIKKTDNNNLQTQSVYLDRTVSLLSPLTLTGIEQDRISSPEELLDPCLGIAVLLRV